MIVHPTTAIQKLRDAGKVPDQWWDTYRARQIETKEASYEERHRPTAAKVVEITTGKAVSAEAKKARQGS